MRIALERISNFKVKPTHSSVEEFGIPKPKHKECAVEPLDYEIYDEQGNLVAYADFTGSNWTFEGSRIMPVSAYKGEFSKQANKPCYIVFRMKREPYPLEQQCLWIRGEDVIKAPIEWRYLGGKNQRNHMTSKADWHRGLAKLVQEIKAVT